jgi:serralysin
LVVRADDHGNTLAKATALPLTATSTGSSFGSTGIISSEADVDVFSVSVGAGTLDFRVKTDARSPNLDVSLEVQDASGAVVAKSQPKTTLIAGTSFTVTSPGTYYLLISGAGYGNPKTDGYSKYGSVGQYTVTGTTTP